MLKRWQRVLNYVNRLLDLIIMIAAYYGAVYLWLIVISENSQNIALEMARSGWLSLAYAMLTVLLYQVAGLYDSVRAKPVWFDIKWVILLNAFAAVSGAATLYLFRMVDFSRGVIAVFFALSSILMIIKRLLVRWVLSFYRNKGYNLKHVVLIGSGELAQKYVSTILHYPRFGFAIDGYIGNRETIQDVPYLGPWKDVGTIELSKPGIDEVVVALDYQNYTLLPQIIAATEKCGTKVSIIPYFNDYIPSGANFETLGECKLLNIHTTPLDYPINAIIKRALDIVCTLILIVLTGPVMLIAAAGVKLSSPGPVIFRQTRMGKNKKLFEMYKFRSMRVNVEQNTAWSKDGDPRKTKFGSFIRKTSIDELPQFLNVIKGDMSLIGPRPEIPYHIERFKETIPLYMLKHIVRPGITGWAQVNNYRGDTSIEERIKYDIWYIENWSLALDIRICFLTAFGGIINKERIR